MGKDEGGKIRGKGDQKRGLKQGTKTGEKMAYDQAAGNNREA